MILVLTTEAGDYSHPRIIDWLNYYNADYFILTGESIFSGRNKVYARGNKIYVNDVNLTDEVTVVFNRRWMTTAELPNLTPDSILNKGIKNSIYSELYDFREFLSFSLDKALWIPNFSSTNVNKLKLLEYARSFKINIPDYIVTNNKEELLKFFNEKKKIITKAIGNFPITKTIDNLNLNPIFTKFVTEDLIDKLPNRFFISLLQEYIPKDREYRVLFFNDEFYSTEILSQEYSGSIIDSRNVENSSNIRIIKSDLPLALKGKLRKLMRKINLIIGSIDIIESNGKFYFLEVNPVGQMSGYSTRANLDFEKNIVEFMIKYDETRKKK
ncbi:hypothetical protein KRE47_12295 [Elizabethkingia meningoseptica]|uniref:hypothetical protein n=1 Tax=Elizabethkingia meningoseptica TaxID=238 RepID=UPI0022F1AE2E|nr:hypothetical protein [Elizabethkingia meningoseptica]EJK5329195.1 hypothetical protein [Elizabethkingia meningoseptica]MDE5468916.1 hypothetical protein [Elizabethkingia meningoseptica]MDE5476230.1 hypothetical protein [Elizabethkingia meningoseptica]MDE5479164.1 hypothetical protein [Elizabethkingia meningoseptica]MDE5485112.1 hypothetical protein [Elizabethkingia meningoseptica]